MSVAITASHGAAVKIGDAASPEVFTEIDGVHGGPSGPGWEPQIIEARHHGSEDTVRKVSTISKSAVSFSIYYDSDDAQHALLLTNASAGTKTNFQMVLTDTGAEQYAFGAYIQMSYKGEVDGFNVYDVSLNIDGDVTVS